MTGGLDGHAGTEDAWAIPGTWNVSFIFCLLQTAESSYWRVQKSVCDNSDNDGLMIIVILMVVFERLNRSKPVKKFA